MKESNMRNNDLSRSAYLDLCIQIEKEIDDIDSHFESSSSVEPAWWLDMMKLQKHVLKTIEMFKHRW